MMIKSIPVTIDCREAVEHDYPIAVQPSQYHDQSALVGIFRGTCDPEGRQAPLADGKGGFHGIENAGLSNPFIIAEEPVGCVDVQGSVIEEDRDHSIA